ncbi:MAG TPA: CrcB family protein [Pseudonocardiaceae bacterium]
MSNDAESAVDPDVDLHVPAQRRELTGHHLRILGVIAVGGGIGALSRYGIETLLPAPPGGFPWGTFLINVTGCFLIGVLMVLVNDVFTGRPLLRPFVGVGILGGFTTFSTYANEVRGLLKPGALPVAFVYLAGTVLCALLAVLAAMLAARAVLARTRRPVTV